MWKAYMTDRVMCYRTKEKEVLIPYIGNLFCVILKSNRLTDRLEGFTRDGLVRNAMSTSTMMVDLGFLLTQRPNAEADGARVPQRNLYKNMLLVDLRPYSSRYVIKLNYGFKMGHRLTLKDNNVIPYKRKEFRASRWHREAGFCVGGNGHHVHVLVGDIYGEENEQEVLTKEYKNMGIYNIRSENPVWAANWGLR